MDRPGSLHATPPYVTRRTHLPKSRLLALLGLYLHNTRTRRQLAELDSRQLADLGISPSERVAEISKPFWR